VTAVSPRAAVDMLFVLVTALMVVRRLAYLYGGRPGTLGVVRLMREVIAHLVLTGGMAAGDSLVQQMLGHGIAAMASVSTRGVICHDTPHLSLHQPRALYWPPFPTMAFQ
jgi:uncharacterized membrane protein YcjF (UPF0283 family)